MMLACKTCIDYLLTQGERLIIHHDIDVVEYAEKNDLLVNIDDDVFVYCHWCDEITPISECCVIEFK